MASFHLISWLCCSFSLLLSTELQQQLTGNYLDFPTLLFPIQSYIFVIKNDGVVEMETGL